MSLNWNEIRVRAKTFAQEFQDAHYEKGETQTFYNEFFNIFGIKRRQVARFEEHIRKLDDRNGFIDLFWPKVLLVEQKSAGRDLAKAADQAGEYFDAIRDKDKPRFQLLCDFQTFELLDRGTRESWSFTLAELPEKVDLFAFMLGREKRKFVDQDPVNIEASELMGVIHDELKASGYLGHNLEAYLVRLLFMLFADDTGIFEPRDTLFDVIENRTHEDGSDLGMWLHRIFEILDTPENQRNANLDEDLDRFPYVNGDLFAKTLPTADFSSAMRDKFLEACRFNWSAVSPAIFGSLFQSVMEPAERRAKGAHYTSEKNIMKVIGPLFLDDLRAEFKRLKQLRRGRAGQLEAFRLRLGTLTFLDPACGCGNFLVIAYRELRQLEIDVLDEIRGDGQLELDAGEFGLSVVDVDQFYGIELEEFPARIAEVAMWMIDHIMNNRMSLAFGQIFTRIPLTKSPHIHHGDALELDWNDVLPAHQCGYVLGNPPFVGHQWRTKEQQAGMHRVWGRSGQVNRLDFVTCWFKKAAEYISDRPETRVAFVAVNSISQGEQASILWPALYALGVNVFFAHRTFQWSSEARGKAAVHCVIVGFSLVDQGHRLIFDYPDLRQEPVVFEANNINGYLIDAANIVVPARSSPRPGLPPMFKGSQPTDGARLRQDDGSLGSVDIHLDAISAATRFQLAA